MLRRFDIGRGNLRISLLDSKRNPIVSSGMVRGDAPQASSEAQVLSIGLFDGIGALRVSLDLLGVHVLGHISVEKEAHASRVVEAAFPGTLVIPDVAAVTEDVVKGWSLQYSQAAVVLLGAGPPCQGVSGLNVDRKGALRDERSSLYVHVARIRHLLRRYFPWAAVHALMESVASMDAADRRHMSADFEAEPWMIDAGCFTWCSRPRLYWCAWELQESHDATASLMESGVRTMVLQAKQELEDVLKGWNKVDASRPFPTFTTSRPRAVAGRKPAGVHQCTDDEIWRWQVDRHRFPPYQYAKRNCVQNAKGEVRLPTIREKEYLLGFPVGYTVPCCPKSQRGSTDYLDRRQTLLGNTWSVPVVSWILGQLFHALGIIDCVTPQMVVNRLQPEHHDMIQSRLLRQTVRPLRGTSSEGDPLELARKMSNLISIKGEDILLSTPSSQMVKYHRLRASVPSTLWRWRVVTGWKWSGQPEHINGLELRAILTSLKWRICHQRHIGCRFLHLTDSLVSLHCSSRKLRRTLCRANALLLASSFQALWGYVHTDDNPADKPSRWGRRVKTKFRK